MVCQQEKIVATCLPVCEHESVYQPQKVDIFDVFATFLRIGVDIIVSCFSDKDNYFSLILSDYVDGAVRFHYANQIMPGLDGLALRYSVGLTPTSLLKNLPKTDCETKPRFSLMRSIVWSVTRRRRLLSDRT